MVSFVIYKEYFLLFLLDNRRYRNKNNTGDRDRVRDSKIIKNKISFADYHQQPHQHNHHQSITILLSHNNL